MGAVEWRNFQWTGDNIGSEWVELTFAKNLDKKIHTFGQDASEVLVAFPDVVQDFGQKDTEVQPMIPHWSTLPRVVPCSRPIPARWALQHSTANESA